MTAPTAPTLTSITTEGLRKAGLSTTSSSWSALLTRAQDEWMSEIKQDIMNVEKRLKSLMQTSYQVTTNGLSIYSNPSDFGDDMNITLMDGSHTGTAQAGGAASITLASTEDVGTSDIIGREIFIYSGTAINQARQCTAYDTTTKVATVSPQWTTQPVANDCYMIVDTYTKLVPVPLWDVDAQTDQSADIPAFFAPKGDSDYGEFMVYPPPYRESGIPWGMKMRYYADLTVVDLSGTLISTLYNRWRTLWVQGVYAKALQWSDDSRAPQEMSTYWNMVRQTVMQEKYGNRLQEMGSTILGYD